MHIIKWSLGLLILILAGAGLFIYTGVYNIAADNPHYKPTFMLIEALRHRSVTVRADEVEVPTDLDNPERIRRGAGNYDAMCASCHLKPGLENTEIRKGLYPQPPNLTEHAHNPAGQFWIIKHGIKMTGMPAWGMAGVDDATIWDMVALLQKLPDMPASTYEQIVSSSAGHSHAGANRAGPNHAQTGAEQQDRHADHPH